MVSQTPLRNLRERIPGRQGGLSGVHEVAVSVFSEARTRKYLRKKH